jgi:hypothetical protein
LPSPQLHSLERNLHGKTHDLEELIRVSHDAAHAKEAAKAELSRVEDMLSNECAKREKEMADRQALWRIKQELVAAAELAHATHSAEPDAAEQEEAPRRTSLASVFADGSRASDAVRVRVCLLLRVLHACDCLRTPLTHSTIPPGWLHVL